MRNFTRPLAATVAALIAAVLILVGVSSPAQAAPLPTPYSGSATASILTTNVSGASLSLAGVDVAPSNVTFNSMLTPRSTAIGKNLAAPVVGLPVGVVALTQTAPPDNTALTSATLPAVAVSTVLNVEPIDATAQARWLGDATCLPSGTPISQVTTQTASAKVLDVLPGGAAVNVGAASTNSSTNLVAGAGGPTDARAVQSKSVGSLASFSLLGGAVQVSVTGNATLTATATGVAGGAAVTYTAPTVLVTVNGATTTLAPSVPFTARPSSLGVPVLGSATVSLGALSSAVTAADGTNASGTVSVLNVDVNLLAGLGSATVALLPMSARATSPVGGVECAAIAPPVVVTPVTGSTTNNPTPTLSGTGLPGATLTVVLDGGAPTTVLVAGDGTWTDTSPLLAIGSHSVSTTQAVGGLTSASSNTTTFTVNTTPPVITPLSVIAITTPATGSTTNTSTPPITGTSDIFSGTITITIDGGAPITVSTNNTGAWTLTPTTPLADGPHVVVATATTGGHTAIPATTAFTVNTTPPVIPTLSVIAITTPTTGSTTNNSTPPITGTSDIFSGTITITIDGGAPITVATNAAGNWTMTPTQPLSTGSHAVVAAEVATFGNVSTGTSRFTVALAAYGGLAPAMTGNGPGGLLILAAFLILMASGILGLPNIRLLRRGYRSNGVSGHTRRLSRRGRRRHGYGAG